MHTKILLSNVKIALKRLLNCVILIGPFLFIILISIIIIIVYFFFKFYPLY